MKTSIPFRKFLAGVACAGFLYHAAHATAGGGYIAHEWGTFTSVQGGDGVQLRWQQQQVSDLPPFVYSWSKPGLNRVPGGWILGKGAYEAQQRMETPVIYFYSQEQRTVDVTVKFPKGLITEWFPQAYQIGPAGARTNSAEFGVVDSRIRWAGIEILPTSSNGGLAQHLHPDKSGNHYFAARKTDSTFIRTSSFAKADPAMEHEKFLFYRGAGSFNTPLVVTADANDELTVSNSGPERLEHLFVFHAGHGKGSFAQLDALEPGESRRVTHHRDADKKPLAETGRAIGRTMVEALINEGLYLKEAEAMVNTWKDSWFTEPGARVFYLLPPAWTDATLPLTLSPAPSELVRVMVGRAELILPSLQHNLRNEFVKAGRGDREAALRALREMKDLGRFVSSAYRLATQGLDADSARAAQDILKNLQTPALARSTAPPID